MKHITAIILALFLTACSTQTTPPAPPPQAELVWSLPDQNYVEYHMAAGTGVFSRDECMIALDPIDPKANTQEVRVTNLKYLFPNGLEGIARVHGAAGVLVTQIPAGLASTLVEASNETFTGEVGNVGASLQWPPEPLVTLNPVAGEDFRVSSAITPSNGAPAFFFTTYYKTVGTGATIDGFPNSTITCLIENPDTQPTVYIQVFSGGDLVELWYGSPAADNTVQLYFVKKTGSGHN